MVSLGVTEDVRLVLDSNLAEGTLTYAHVIQDRSVSWSFPSE